MVADHFRRTQEPRGDRRGWVAIVIAAVVPIAIGVVAVLAVPPMPASALSNYLSSPGAPTGALASCVLCHSSYPSSYARNAYGSDFAANSHSFSAIADMDSDGDGATNAAEFAAGTWPGDASSVPAPQPTPTSTPVPPAPLPTNTPGPPAPSSVRLYMPLTFSGRLAFRVGY